MNRSPLMKYARPAALIGSLGALLTVTLAEATTMERAFIDSFVAVPTSVSSVIGSILPESNQVGKSFLSSSFSPNLEIAEDANVFVTFVHEGAGYRNSLGYFTYTNDVGQVHVVDRQLVLPNASYADPQKGWGGGTLVSGDTVTLRDANGQPRAFHAGEHVGFFLVADGWNGSGVRGWNSSNPTLPSSSAAVNASNRVFTSIDVLNPENSTGRSDLARHVAMLKIAGLPDFLGQQDFILMGFEDQRRDTGSDNDFNDLVLLVRSNPIEAIQTSSDVPYYVTGNPDPDGDGVQGLSDYFPLDGNRAFITRTPAAGWSTIAFEDRYPDVGDADYNDCVVDMAFEEVLAANGRLKDLGGTFHLVARGATFDHAMGVALHGLPENATGTLR
ncbi:MAG: LruC domain-containing protein, partial [Polyangiaceae bacterium]